MTFGIITTSADNKPLITNTYAKFDRKLIKRQRNTGLHGIF